MKKELVTFVLTGLLAFGTTGLVFAETPPVVDPITSDPAIVTADPQALLTLGEASQKALAAVPDGTLVSIRLDSEHGVMVYKFKILSGTATNMVKLNALTGEVIKVAAEPEVVAEEPTVDPVVDPATDPTVDPATDPVVDPTADPVAEPTAEPVVDPLLDPVVDPTLDPVVDPDPIPMAISFEEAVQVALGSVINGTFVSVKLDTEQGVSVYKVILRTGKNANMIKVDPISSEILKPANVKNENKPVVEKEKKVNENANSGSVKKAGGSAKK